MKSFFRNPTWWLYLPIVVVPLLLFGVPLSQGKVIYWGTAGLQFVPWREYAYVQLEQGVLPLWNPLNGMGAPLIANYQLALFYPPGWLTILGHWLSGAPGVAWVYTLLVALHLVWAGLGMVVFLHSLGFKPLGQVVAALAFGMGGYFVARASFFSMIWAGSWMGWILWAASGISSPLSPAAAPKRRFWLALFTGLMLLAGHAQLSWYILLFAGIWVVTGAWLTSGIKRAALSGLIFIGLVMLGGLLAGIQLAPTFEYLLQSQRADAYDYTQAMTYSYWPWRLLTFLNPEMFGNPGLGDYWGYGAYWEDAAYLGVFPFFLALGTLKFLFRRREGVNRRGVVFLWGMVLIGLAFALGDHTPLFPWLYRHAPTFDQFQAPARWMIWVATALSILAAIGAEAWARPEGRALKWTRLGAAGFGAVTIGAGLGNVLLPELSPGLMRGFMIFGGLGVAWCLASLLKPVSEISHRHLWWNASVAAILSLDLLLASLFLNPFVASSFFSPAALTDGGAGYQGGRIFISAADEYELKFNKYLRFTDTRYTCEFNDIRLDMLPNLNLLNGIGSANNFDPLVPARYQTWMNAVNKIDPVERDAYLAFMGVDKVIQRVGEHQTELRQVNLPVEGLVEAFPCATIVRGPEEALEATLAKIGRSESRACIIVEASNEILAEEFELQARISAVDAGYQRIEFRIDTEHPVWLRIGMTWYPGWQASIDGSETPIYHGDYLFSAILAPVGSHQVVLSYRPFSLTIGAGMTGAGAVLIILVGFWVHKKAARQVEGI